jgi:hypothetical protein
MRLGMAHRHGVKRSTGGRRYHLGRIVGNDVGIRRDRG